MKRIVCLLLVLCCVLSLCACGDNASSSGSNTTIKKYEGDGFDSPEEAVTRYLEGLKEMDYEKMLSAFAWESQISHFSVNAYLKHLKSVQLTYIPRMPSNNDFLFSANVNAIRATQTKYIYDSIEAYLRGYSYNYAKTYTFDKEYEVDEYLALFNKEKIQKLTEMTNIRFLSPDSVTDNKYSKTKESRDKNLEKYGADEVESVVALADVGEEILFFCPTVVRYGNKWYIASVASDVHSLLSIYNPYYGFICFKGTLHELLEYY